MRRFCTTLVAIQGASLLLLAAASAQTTEKLDLSQQPTLYVVGYAHLDTEWRWEYPQVIDEYIRKTMGDNFALLDKYPHYVFNFSGANRYRFMKEYFPADFARLKKYVDEGRWFPTGSSMEEGDVNAPSAEAIIRQVLYGNNWFRKELGKASGDYMLPDAVSQQSIFTLRLQPTPVHACRQHHSSGGHRLASVKLAHVAFTRRSKLFNGT